VAHYFNYDLMKQLNYDKQMKRRLETYCNRTLGKILRQTPDTKTAFSFDTFNFGFDKAKSWIFDPFTGSSTTGIAANLANRRFLGIDQEAGFLAISKNRKLEIENPNKAATYRQKIGGFSDKKQLELLLVDEPQTEYKTELNFDPPQASHQLKQLWQNFAIRG